MTVTPLFSGSNGTYKWIPSTHNKDRSAIRFVLTSNTPGSDSELQTYGLWALRLAFLNTTDPADSTKVSIVSVQVSENSCPGNCSGHGVCNTTTHTCNCEQGAWAGSDCSSPVQIATPDELHYTSNDHHIVPGTNLAGKQFELEQEKHLTVALNLSWAPTGTSFVINVTGLPNPHSDVWCPAYPVVQVGREPFDGDLAPDGGLECYGSNKHISKTVCGNDFHPGG